MPSLGSCHQGFSCPARRPAPRAAGPGLLGGPRTLPEDAAREEDLILHLVGGAPGNLHTVFVLLLHPVPHVILPGDVTPVVDLEAGHGMRWNKHWGRAFPGHLQPPGEARTLDLHLGFPSGSVMVPPYSTGNWSGLIYFSKTSFQFAGRRGKEGEKKKKGSALGRISSQPWQSTHTRQNKTRPPPHTKRGPWEHRTCTQLCRGLEGPSPRGLRPHGLWPAAQPEASHSALSLGPPAASQDHGGREVN